MIDAFKLNKTCEVFTDNPSNNVSSTLESHPVF